MGYSTTTSSTLGTIAELYAEQQSLWAKGGGCEKLSAAERGRLTDIRLKLERLWDARRQEKAGASLGALDSSVQTPYSPSRARFHYRHGRADRRAQAVNWSH